MNTGTPRDVNQDDHRAGTIPISAGDLGKGEYRALVRTDPRPGPWIGQYASRSKEIVEAARDRGAWAKVAAEHPESPRREIHKTVPGQALLADSPGFAPPRTTGSAVRTGVETIAYETTGARGRRLPFLTLAGEAEGGIRTQKTVKYPERPTHGRDVLPGGFCGAQRVVGGLIAEWIGAVAANGVNGPRGLAGRARRDIRRLTRQPAAPEHKHSP